MDKEALTNELKVIIEDILKSQNLDLVELVNRYEGKDLILRILADRPEGGITLAECAYLNKEISRILDENEILRERYILEVSSPGLDRPLKTKSDFARCKNKQVRFFLSKPINDKWELEGLISEVREEAVVINMHLETVEIPFSNITKAKQIF